ncbi:Probable folate-biopterin transporter 4 [Linum perenne]
MVLLTAQNLGSAMADVVVDAMIAEAVRFEKASFAGDLQSLSWFSMALGGICGSLLGGFALSNLSIDKIFLLFSVLPAIQLFSCCLVEENPVVSEVVSASDDSDDPSHSDDNSYFLRKSTTTNSRRRKKKKKGKKKKFSSKSQVNQKENSGKLGWYYSLKSASCSLLQAFRQPIILRYTHIGLSLMTLLDMVLVSRMNLGYGIPDKHIVLFGSALADAINQFKFMPFLILSGQLCPPGIEGTLFALFMSINNLGSTIGSFVGAGLASFLNLSSGSYDNLLLGIAIQVACIYVPVLFLFLIPKEATGVST